MGKGNTMIGYGAGIHVEGDNNFIIGNHSGLDVTTQSNQIRIGDYACADGKDMIILHGGRIAITKKAWDLLVNIDIDKLAQEWVDDHE